MSMVYPNVPDMKYDIATKIGGSLSVKNQLVGHYGFATTFKFWYDFIKKNHKYSYSVIEISILMDDDAKWLMCLVSTQWFH